MTPRQRPPLPDFRRLPERVEPEDLVASEDVTPARDPRGGRDTERDFMLRYGVPL